MQQEYQPVVKPIEQEK
jgi:hypothetical protein